MTQKSERTALAFMAMLIGSLVGTASYWPPTGQTASPKAVLDQSPSASIDTVAGTSSRFLPRKARGSEALLDVIDVARPDAGHLSYPVNSAADLARAFNRMGYDLDSIGAGQADVPRVFLASMPEDIDTVSEARKRKRLFFKTVLPLVLQINEEIAADRRRLNELVTVGKRGEKIAPADRLWLIVMAERYKTKRGDLKTLLKRVDVIPPSIALAQAAEESGWGTSRFVREGNAMFGQWTWSKVTDGIVPNGRDEGKTHKIKAFDSLLHSVRAYARNLNTHRAYQPLRDRRSQLRNTGKALDGMKLADQLTRYSARGEQYVKTLRTIIGVNKLRRFDDARLITSPEKRPVI